MPRTRLGHSSCHTGTVTVTRRRQSQLRKRLWQTEVKLTAALHYQRARCAVTFICGAERVLLQLRRGVQRSRPGQSSQWSNPANQMIGSCCAHQTISPRQTSAERKKQCGWLVCSIAGAWTPAPVVCMSASSSLHTRISNSVGSAHRNGRAGGHASARAP
jgi:hypothetical protein